jgi:hypothetical protein
LTKRKEKRRSELGLYLALEKISAIIYVSKEREKEFGMAKYVCVEVTDCFDVEFTWFEDLIKARDYLVGEIMRQMGVTVPETKLFTRVKGNGDVVIESEHSCCEQAQLSEDLMSGWYKDEGWEIRYFVEEIPQ